MAVKRYTLEEIEAMEQEMLTPAIVAGCLRWNPYSINIQAHQDPKALGFPVCIHGRRVCIPRRAFVAWCRQNEVGART